VRVNPRFKRRLIKGSIDVPNPCSAKAKLVRLTPDVDVYSLGSRTSPVIDSELLENIFKIESKFIFVRSVTGERLELNRHSAMSNVVGDMEGSCGQDPKFHIARAIEAILRYWTNKRKRLRAQGTEMGVGCSRGPQETTKLRVPIHVL
jgi:hypothetical protein